MKTVFLVGFLVLVFLGLLVTAWDNLHRAWLIWSTPTTPCGEVTPGGLTELNGQISALSKTVVSPMTKSHCVYYKFQVEEKVRQGKSSTWVERASDVDHSLVLLEDETGAVELGIGEAELHLKTAHTETSGLLRNPSPKLEALLAEHELEGAGTVFNKKLRYTETILEVGDSLYVLGEVSDTGDDGFLVVGANLAGLMLVSDSSEGRFLGSQVFWGGVQLSGALAVAGFGLFWLVSWT